MIVFTKPNSKSIAKPDKLLFGIHIYINVELFYSWCLDISLVWHAWLYLCKYRELPTTQQSDRNVSGWFVEKDTIVDLILRLTPFSVQPTMGSLDEPSGRVSVYTKKVTRELVEYTVNYFAQNSGAKPTSTHAETLKRTMDEVSTRHKLVFSNMAQKLEISKDNLEDVFINVVAEMFTDNQLNWGRIVTIYAFGGHIARYCKRSGMVELLPRLIKVLSDYITRRFGPWIDHKGGWVSLIY